MRNLNLTDEQYAALGLIVAYLENGEHQNYQDRGAPAGHIYESVRTVALAMPDNRPDMPPASQFWTVTDEGHTVRGRPLRIEETTPEPDAEPD